MCIPWDVTKFHSCLNVTDFRVQLPNSMENVCCSYSCFCIRTFSSAAVVGISACLQFQPQPWDIPLRDCKRKSENYNLDSHSIWSFPYLLFHHVTAFMHPSPSPLSSCFQQSTSSCQTSTTWANHSNFPNRHLASQQIGIVPACMTGFEMWFYQSPYCSWALWLNFCWLII